MTTQNPNDPNTPNSPQAESVESVTVNQVDLANELSQSLENININLESITNSTRSQSDLFISLIDSFEKIHDAVEEMADSSKKIADNIERAANSVLERFSERNFAIINKSLDKVANTAIGGITSQASAFTDLSKSSGDFQNKNKTLTESMSDSSKGLLSEQQKNKKEAEDLKNKVEDLNQTYDDIGETAERVAEQVENLSGGIYGTVKSLTSGITGALGAIFNSMSSLVGAAKEFFSFSLTLPFTITSEAVKLGNMIRTDLVEVIQTSVEAAKEKFDLGSHIGRGIVEMGERGKEMLMEFQNPASEMVKLFGYEASGIANRNAFMVENIAAMGHYSEIFGRSLMNNEQNLIRFTKLIKAFGFTGEDVKLLALDATNNLAHINVEMEQLGHVLTSVSNEYNIDRKRLAKNVMSIKRDIITFGHLSNEEITRTAAKITHMRVRLEDAAAVFKKFSTFEDAANSVAMLSQTFGMNLSAMELIQAKSPEQIFTMFRDAMHETGRSFEDLNRFEKELMAQHTGMSAESLKALMHYENLGYSYQEAVDKMNAERPEAKQMEALKGLNSAVKEIQKVLQFTSPFSAFADGIMSNATLTGSLKDTMVSLSKGYQGIYEYAKGLNPEVWRGIIEPIKLVLGVMTQIFESKGFKKGLLGALKSVSNFVARIFGVTSEDVVLENLKSSVTSVMQSDKLSQDQKDKFKNAIGTRITNALKNHKQELSLYSRDLPSLLKKQDTVGILDALQKISMRADIPDHIGKVVKTLTKMINDSFMTVKVAESDGNVKSASASVAQQFVREVEENLKQNEENLSKTANLSMKITGAIIMGAGTGFVALLKLVNDGIDAADNFLSQDSVKQTNLLAQYLHLEPERLVELGTGLNRGIRGLFNRKGKLFNLASWVVSGFSDMFEIIIDMFLHTLAGGLEGIFGDLFTYEPSARQKLNMTKFDPAAQQKGATSAIKSLSSGKEVKGQDAGALSNMLTQKIETVKDEDTQNALRAALERQTEDFIDSDGGAKASRKLAFSSMSMLQNIKDGKYLGNNIIKDASGKITGIDEDITKSALNFGNNFLKTLKGSYAGRFIESKFGLKLANEFSPSILSDYSTTSLLSHMNSDFNLNELLSVLNSFRIEKNGNILNPGNKKDLAIIRSIKSDELHSKIKNQIKNKINNKNKKNYNVILADLFSAVLLKDKSMTGASMSAEPTLSLTSSKKEYDSFINPSKFGDAFNLSKNILSKGRSSTLSNEMYRKNPAMKQSLQDAITFSDGSTATPTTSTASTASTPTAAASPIPPKTQTIQAGGAKVNVATKTDVAQATTKLQNKKKQIQSSGPKNVSVPALTLSNEQYNMLATNLLKLGNLLQKSTLPQNAGISDYYLNLNSLIHRSAAGASNPSVTPKIQQNNNVLNTSAQQQP